MLGRITSIFVAASCCVQIYAQTNSIEFQDTVANQKTGAIGYKGTANNGYVFIETPNSPDVKIQSGNIVTQGNVTAVKYYKGSAEFDSVKASALSDSTKKIPDGIITNAKIASSLKVKDENVDSISWAKIKGMPAGFADGVDNVGGGTVADSVRAAAIADSCKKIPRNIKVDSARVAVLADSAKKIADGTITAAKFAPSLKIQADTSRAAFLADTVKRIPKNIKVDTAKVAENIISSTIIAGTQVTPSFGYSGVSTRSGYTLINNTTTNLDVRFSIENDWLFMSKYYNGSWAAIIGYYLPSSSTITNYFGDMKIIKDGGAELIVGMQPHESGNVKITHNGTDGTITSSKGNLNLVPGTGGVVHVNGTFSAVSCGTCSDIRYKTNICPLNDPISKVKDLNGVSFTYNYDGFPEKNFPKEKQIGFIAQDIEKTVPEVVMTDEKGFKTVDYSKLTALLVEAMKTQQKMIEAQQEEINSLKEIMGAK